MMCGLINCGGGYGYADRNIYRLEQMQDMLEEAKKLLSYGLSRNQELQVTNRSGNNRIESEGRNFRSTVQVTL